MANFNNKEGGGGDIIPFTPLPRGLQQRRGAHNEPREAVPARRQSTKDAIHRNLVEKVKPVEQVNDLLEAVRPGIARAFFGKENPELLQLSDIFTDQYGVPDFHSAAAAALSTTRLGDFWNTDMLSRLEKAVPNGVKVKRIPGHGFEIKIGGLRYGGSAYIFIIPKGEKAQDHECQNGHRECPYLFAEAEIPLNDVPLEAAVTPPKGSNIHNYEGVTLYPSGTQIRYKPQAEIAVVACIEMMRPDYLADIYRLSSMAAKSQ